jgi:hypothetical protein
MLVRKPVHTDISPVGAKQFTERDFFGAPLHRIRNEYMDSEASNHHRDDGGGRTQLGQPSVVSVIGRVDLFGRMRFMH